MVTPVVHLYRPGVRTEPPMRPAFNPTKFGPGRLLASVYAACISRTAVVKRPGVGRASVDPITRPFTCVEVQNCLLTSWTRLNPVTEVIVAGLTPTLPLTAELGTEETPVSARTAKFAAVPSRTGAGPAANAHPLMASNTKPTMFGKALCIFSGDEV